MTTPFIVRCRISITPPKGMLVGSDMTEILQEMVSDALRLHGIETDSVIVLRGRGLRGKGANKKGDNNV
jgi:hypothetical protein